MQVAEEIWVVENKGVTKWRGGIEAYKEHLRATHAVSAGVAVYIHEPLHLVLGKQVLCF